MPRNQRYVVRGKGRKVVKRGRMKSKTAVDRKQDKRLRKIEKLLKADKKMCDLPIPVVSLQKPDASGVGVHAMHLTNQIHHGDLQFQREGDKITIKNMYLQLKVAAEASVPLSVVNVVGVYFPEGLIGNLTPGTLYSWSTTGDAIDKFNAMTKSYQEPLGGDVHQYISDDSFYGHNQYTFKTLFNSNVDFRYRLLFNKQIKLNNGSTVTTYGTKHEKYLNIKLDKMKGKVIDYATKVPSIVEPTRCEKGSVVLYAWCDRPDTEEGRPAIGGVCRMKWLG